MQEHQFRPPFPTWRWHMGNVEMVLTWSFISRSHEETVSENLESAEKVLETANSHSSSIHRRSLYRDRIYEHTIPSSPHHSPLLYDKPRNSKDSRWNICLPGTFQPQSTRTLQQRELCRQGRGHEWNGRLLRHSRLCIHVLAPVWQPVRQYVPSKLLYYRRTDSP
jgi:hypothetical protein